MAINYIKQFEDGSTVATATKPSYGLYTATKANDDRDVYKNGLWYPASNGGELDIGVWTESRCTSVVEGDSIKLTVSDGSDIDINYSTDLTGLIVGETYIYKVKFGSMTTVNAYIRDTQGNSTASSSSAIEHVIKFVAEDTTNTIRITARENAVGQYVYINSKTVYKLEPTLCEPYTEQFTYASKDGKLLGVEVANGQPVDLHYDEYAPTLVEDTIQATNMISDNFVGKNACTAWVNFDGTTTPPTIRDSFNVSDVVRTATGYYEVYFETPMDNIDYTYSFTGQRLGSNTGLVSAPVSGILRTNKLYMVTRQTNDASIDPQFATLNFFGGKN